MDFMTSEDPILVASDSRHNLTLERSGGHAMTVFSVLLKSRANLRNVFNGSPLTNEIHSSSEYTFTEHVVFVRLSVR